ncbi:unnamed protein product [Adineta ricciae]|uniref:Uncharacterized protein n=1 Tax=Adineta ricciae TaxID=249248 RepID=A0A814UMW1_ADIRI|nr:unnamed protein product [Adineta ricciae]
MIENILNSFDELGDSSTEQFPNSFTPNLKPYYALPCSLWKAIVAIHRFKPNVIVGSSFGGFIAMFLLQTRVWKGDTILLAPATGLLFKKRLWLPAGEQNNIVIVAGANDTTVPLDGLSKLQNLSLNNVQFLVVEDEHQLNTSMIEQNQLKDLINANYQPSITNNTINNYFDCTRLWLRCLLSLIVSFIREPLTLYHTTKRLREMKRETYKPD